MELEKALDDFFKFWRLIYNMNENKIEEVWEADTLERLIEEFKKEENEIEPMGTTCQQRPGSYQ